MSIIYEHTIHYGDNTGYRVIQGGRLVKLMKCSCGEGKGKGKETVEWMCWVHS